MLEPELKDLCKKLKPLLGRRADALWLACDGYIDLLDAQAAGGRTAQPFSSSL